MPIEIRELIIRASVNDEPAGEASAEGSSPGEDIIAECVEQVMEIIAQKEER